MDDGYKLLVEKLIPLDHDRYKSYFAQFVTLHFSLFVAISTQFKSQYRELSAIGIFLCVIWFILLLKIISDIKNKWAAVESYENNSACTQIIKLSKIKRMKLPGSVLLLFIPIGFLAAYIVILCHGVCIRA